MTNWTAFSGDRSNGEFITMSMVQQIINNTSNIYERIMVLESLKGGGTPVGSVMLWYGVAASIPQGYQLADGTNGTPDLRDRFLMGLASTETDDNLLESGGETQHQHAMGAVTAATKHKHTVYLNNSSGAVSVSSSGTTELAGGGHNHSWSAETATADKHTHSGTYASSDHLPAYTKYYWIARIPA